MATSAPSAAWEHRHRSTDARVASGDERHLFSSLPAGCSFGALDRACIFHLRLEARFSRALFRKWRPWLLHDCGLVIGVPLSPGVCAGASALHESAPR